MTVNLSLYFENVIVQKRLHKTKICKKVLNMKIVGRINGINK